MKSRRRPFSPPHPLPRTEDEEGTSLPVCNFNGGGEGRKKVLALSQEEEKKSCSFAKRGNEKEEEEEEVCCFWAVLKENDATTTTMSPFFARADSVGGTLRQGRQVVWTGAENSGHILRRRRPRPAGP